MGLAGLMVIAGVVLSLADRYGDIVFGYSIPGYFRPNDWFSLRLVLDRPGEFLTLLLFFWTGRWLGAITRAPAPPSADTLTYGVKLAVGAGTLFLAGPLWRGVVAAVAGGEFYEDALHAISPGGSYYILPLLTLFLAITRRNGMRLAAVLAGTYYALYASAPGRSFPVDFAAFAVVIAFGLLGARIAARLPAVDVARTASWLPTPSVDTQSSIELDEWRRQHDEISNTVRRVMLSLLAYTLFCGLTLAASEDASLFGGSMVTLPSPTRQLTTRPF